MKDGDITHCDCGHDAIALGIGTGYAIKTDGSNICYACAAIEDAKTLRETGKLYGYLTYEQKPKPWHRTGFESIENGAFTNWPGTFRLPVDRVKRSILRTPTGGAYPRLDFWIEWNGARYHGTQIGEQSQIARLVRVKR